MIQRLTTTKGKPAAIPTGVIDPERLYTLDAFEQLTGLGRAARSSALQRGLKVLRFGGRGFILGRDFIAFLQDNAGLNDSKSA